MNLNKIDSSLIFIIPKADNEKILFRMTVMIYYFFFYTSIRYGKEETTPLTLLWLDLQKLVCP